MSICPSRFHLIITDLMGLLKGPDSLKVYHSLETDFIKVLWEKQQKAMKCQKHNERDTRRVQGWVHTKTRIQSSSTPRLLKYCSKTCTLHEDSHFLLLKLPLHYDLNAKDCTFTPLHLLESHNIGYLVWKDECWFMCCATFGSLVHWILNSLRFLLEYCLCGWLSLWLKAKLSPKWNLGFFWGNVYESNRHVKE